MALFPAAVGLALFELGRRKGMPIAILGVLLVAILRASGLTVTGGDFVRDTGAATRLLLIETIKGILVYGGAFAAIAAVNHYFLAQTKSR